TIVRRLFGGPDAVSASPAPVVRRPTLMDRLRLGREMLTTILWTPRRGRSLFRAMRREAAALSTLELGRLDDAALTRHLQRFGATLLHESRLLHLHEVVSAQSRAYMALSALLAAWTQG